MYEDEDHVFSPGDRVQLACHLRNRDIEKWFPSFAKLRREVAGCGEAMPFVLSYAVGTVVAM